MMEGSQLHTTQSEELIQQTFEASYVANLEQHIHEGMVEAFENCSIPLSSIETIFVQNKKK